MSVDPREDLIVITAISNACRYKSRPRLYKRFEEMMKHTGYHLVTVELAFGQRAHEVTDAKNHLHLQLRTFEEFWHKENLLNAGIAHVRRQFPNATKVAWIDADMRPARPYPDWLEETWHELQHYKFVQMWEWLQPLDSHYNPLCRPNPSFMKNYLEYGTPYPKDEKGYPISWGSPGGAWAADLDAIDAIGGIPDRAILGAGDWYLAHMLISDLSIPEMEDYSAGYRDYFDHIQKLCARHIKKDVGVVKGLLYHDFHGHTVNRGYNTRENILKWFKFDPRYDLKRDHQGIYQMETHEDRQIKMYEKIRAYFRARNEDQISG